MKLKGLDEILPEDSDEVKPTDVAHLPSQMNLLSPVEEV